MVSTFTPNIQLEEPARGDDVGVWDTPVNSNMTITDLVVGGITTIALNNSPVVLNAAQFRNKTIVFNSTLTGNVTITLPTSFTKSYEIYNGCTGSSAFTVTLQTTGAGGQAICPPPGEFIDAINDGTNLKFKNFGRIGSYWDYAGSSIPNWVSGCTVAPYLNCDGTSFSSATYPTLTTLIGVNLTPDGRGRTRFALDGGTGRISSAAGGFSAPVVGGSGGSQTITLGTSNLPPYTPTGAISVTPPGFLGFTVPGVNVGHGGTATGGNDSAPSWTFTGNAQGGVSAPVSNIPPAYIGGLTLIRAG